MKFITLHTIGKMVPNYSTNRLEPSLNIEVVNVSKIQSIRHRSHGSDVFLVDRSLSVIETVGTIQRLIEMSKE